MICGSNECIEGNAFLSLEMSIGLYVCTCTDGSGSTLDVEQLRADIQIRLRDPDILRQILEGDPNAVKSENKGVAGDSQYFQCNCNAVLE